MPIYNSSTDHIRTLNRAVVEIPKGRIVNSSGTGLASNDDATIFGVTNTEIRQELEVTVSKAYDMIEIDTDDLTIVENDEIGCANLGKCKKYSAGAKVGKAKSSVRNGRVLVYLYPTFASSNGASAFTDLSDVPASYTGESGKVVKVKGTEDGLEFGTVSTSFIGLTDTPADYTGQSGKITKVNVGETALEFVTPVESFIGLSDTPSDYTGQANKLLTVNVGETALEYLDRNDLLDILSNKQEVINKIEKLYTDTPDVILTTTGAPDLQTAIDNLLDGQILEIKTNGTYDPITINSGKSFSIRVAKGYAPVLTGDRCIRLMNGANNIIISGLVIDTPTNGGGNINYTGSAITFGEHQAIVDNIIFHDITVRNVASGSAVILSYHWSVSGDLYYNWTELIESSTNVSFVNCHFHKSCSDGNEGGIITCRGLINGLFLNNIMDNFEQDGRGIQLQGTVNTLIENNNIGNFKLSGGIGNAECIKIDSIGTPTYFNTAIVKENTCYKGYEGIDIDDICECIAIDNTCKDCIDEGISLDNDSRAYIEGNTCYRNGSGIRLESGSIANLKMNNCFNNTLDYRIENGYSVDDSNISDELKVFDSYLPYDNTISELVSTNVKDAIDEVNSKIAIENYIDLYEYSATYSVSGGGGALATSIATNGGGTEGNPNVYEITDSLTYTGNIDLSNYNYIVIRGAVGQRPTIDTSTGNSFRITGNVNHNYCMIGNLNIELSVDDRYVFYIWRQTGGTTTVNGIYLKDIQINGNTTDSTNDSTGGLVIKDDSGSTTFWANDVIVEDCFFNNVCSRTDSGAIMTFGVDNYIGNRNKFTWSGIPFGGVNKLRNTYWHRGCNALEKNSIFYGGINEVSDSYRHYVKLAQDYLGNFNQPTTVILDGCIFADNPNVNRAVITHNFDNTSTTTLNSLDLTIKNCKFLNCDGSAYIIRSDSIAHNNLVSLTFKDNTFTNCKSAYKKDATMVSTLKSQLVYNNVYNNVETISYAFTDLDLKDAIGDTTIISQLEPTGFDYPENVVVSYDSTTRTVTLTGTFKAYFKGKELKILTSGWVSPAHTDVNDIYFLYYDGTSFQWSTSYPNFYHMWIAFVNYGATYKFAIRECHGLMTWQTHLELHEQIGTFRQSGGSLSGYVLSSITASDRRPDVSETILYDEDLKSILPLLNTETYTRGHLTSTGTFTFTTSATNIVPLTGSQPQYNQFTGGNWQLTNMSNNYYMSVWLLAIPTSSDAGSQSYRFIWVTGQTQNVSLGVQQSRTPNDLNLGNLSELSTEFVFIAKIILQYTAGNWVLTQVDNILGNKFSQTNVTGFINNHANLSNLQGGITNEYYHLTSSNYNTISVSTSGTWTPTITGVINHNTQTAYVGTYLRLGNVVSCAVRIDQTPNTASVSQIRISLPIASNFDSVQDINGNYITSFNDLGGYLDADTTNNEANIYISGSIHTDTSSKALWITFQYIVK